MTPRHFAWQARHKLTSSIVLRGRRGTNSHLPSFCVAGVALMALGGALGLGLVARDAAALCVAGAAQTHSSFSHRTFTHTIFHHTILHTPLCHTPSFTTPSFTHTTLSHTIFRHTIFHTPLCHTPSFTQLCHTLSFTHNFRTHHLSHTALSHTHTPSFFVTHHLSHSTLSHTTVLTSSPPPSPFLPSPSLLQPLMLIIGSG